MPTSPPDAITIEIGSLDVPIGDNLEFTVANCPEGGPVKATFDDESQTDPVDPSGSAPDPDGGLPGAGTSNTISIIRIGLVVTEAVMVVVVAARRRCGRPI